MTLEPLLREHPFLAGLEPEYLALLAGCATNVRFGEGLFLFREGGAADRCFLIREGKMALEIAAPGCGPVIVETLAAGEVAGFSWLLEPRLGFELMRLFARLAVRRLQATRLRLLDVYGDAHAPAV